MGDITIAILSVGQALAFIISFNPPPNPVRSMVIERLNDLPTPMRTGSAGERRGSQTRIVRVPFNKERSSSCLSFYCSIYCVVQVYINRCFRLAVLAQL